MDNKIETLTKKGSTVELNTKYTNSTFSKKGSGKKESVDANKLLNIIQKQNKPKKG